MPVKVIKGIETPSANANDNRPPKILTARAVVATPAAAQIKLVDIKKAAEFLNVSVSTVRRLRMSGAIAACRVGGRVMFNLFELVAFVRQGQVGDLARGTHLTMPGRN
jgi:excisionase family DNA binding protein